MEGKRGLFIAFEGIDGCGKSTQLKKFVDYLIVLDKANHVVVTREPYKKVSVKDILREDDNPRTNAEKLAEIFISDRKEHAAELIVPSVEKGWLVVCDRYKLSTIAYQSSQGLDMMRLIELQKDLPVPDMTFVFDLSSRSAAKRMMGEQDRAAPHKFEANLDFLENTRQQFKRAAGVLGEKIVIIDAERNVEEVFEDVKRNFVKEFGSYFGKPAEKKKKYDFMEDVPDRIKKELAKYFTSVGGDTFAIVGMPPELTGGALARYSRAPTGMQLTIVNEFLDESGKPNQEKGSELMDRVLNAYGDESVGELEGAHLGLENISQVLTKSIEDRRIGGSPIEQSTRYVKYDQKDKSGKWRYLRPKEIMDSEFANEFEAVNDLAFEVYSEGVRRLIEYFKKQFPEENFEIEVERDGKNVKAKKSFLKGEDEERAFKNAYNFTVRCAALDVGRCVLPSSTLTHLGVFGNGRFFTNVITQMKSGELEEERVRALDIERELGKVIPTFIKRNREIPAIAERHAAMRRLGVELFSGVKPDALWVDLVENNDYLDQVVASALYPYANISLRQILRELKKMPEARKLEILEKYIGKRENRRDRTGRGLEAGYPLTFDLVGCFAEFRDLERHRMLTQQRQMLTTDLGFIMPPEMKEVRFDGEVEEVVKRMEVLNRTLRENGLLAASQYATLFNHRLRFMLGMNLREFQHLSELRTQPAGHFSYRSMVMEMARQVNEKIHWAHKAFGFVDYSDPGNRITRAKEQSRIAGGNLKKGLEGDVDL